MGNQERIHLVKILIYLMHEILYSFSLYFIVLFCIGVRLGLYNEGYWLIILFCNIYIYIFVLVLLFIIIRYRSPMLHLIMYYCFRKGMKAALPLNTFIKKKIQDISPVTHLISKFIHAWKFLPFSFFPPQTQKHVGVCMVVSLLLDAR
jgi:hypothetical protein